MDIVRPKPTPRVCLTHNVEIVTSLPGSPCRVKITRQVLLKEPKRTVCTPCRDKLIESHYKMALWAANLLWAKSPIYSKRMDQQEAASIALLALVKCAARYDPNKGKLGTILMWYVRSELQNQVVHHGGAVSLPLHTSRRNNRRSRHHDQLENALKAPYSLERIYRDKGLTYTQPPTLPELQEEAHPRMEEIKAVVGWGSDNTPRERKAFIDNVLYGRTLAEIGAEQGFTKEFARQLKNRALSNIRETLEDKGITA